VQSTLSTRLSEAQHPFVGSDIATHETGGNDGFDAARARAGVDVLAFSE
jgi:hypothetical protein